jgi:hypothetical protein
MKFLPVFWVGFAIILGTVAQIGVYQLQTAYCTLMEGSDYYYQYKLQKRCHHIVKVFNNKVSKKVTCFLAI